MATKKHNPGCPCCGCRCPGDPGFFSRSFVNTPTVKVVVSGLPATLAHVYVRVRANIFEFDNKIFYTTYVGLDQLNGTYFFEYSKVNKCIVPPLDGSEDIGTTFIRDERSAIPGSSPCTENVLIYEERAEIGIVVGDYQSAGVNLPFNAFISITGSQVGRCRTDYIPVIDGLVNNGDIIVSRLTNDATPCDTRFRSFVTDSVETEVIGNVTYEMLDLP